MWIKVNDIHVGNNVEVIAINSTTAKALWVTEINPNTFHLQLETVLEVREQLPIRHLALLGVFQTSAQAKQKAIEFLEAVAEYEGLFKM